MMGLAVLFLFAVLLLRILRVALLLPSGQLFERLLVIGICIHFAVQVIIMVGGTLNLLPMTGVTIPFLSQGGMALLVNLTEIGLVLAIAQRLERAAVMTLERRAWFIADAIVLILLALSLRLLYWQMLRGEDILPLQLVTGEGLCTSRGKEHVERGSAAQRAPG